MNFCWWMTTSLSYLYYFRSVYKILLKELFEIRFPVCSQIFPDFPRFHLIFSTELSITELWGITIHLLLLSLAGIYQNQFSPLNYTKSSCKQSVSSYKFKFFLLFFIREWNCPHYLLNNNIINLLELETEEKKIAELKNLVGLLPESSAKVLNRLMYHLKL